MKLYWTRLRRHICLFANGTGDLTLLVPPVAERGATGRDLRFCLGEAFEIMDAYNDAHSECSRSRIEYASDELLERINGVASRSLRLGAGPMSGDYLYPASNMIDLPGSALKSKRQLRTRFLREHPDHRVEALGDAHTADCLALLDLWRQRADTQHAGQVTEDDYVLSTEILRRRETSACEIALRHRTDLRLSGLVVYCGDELVGFTLGESLSPSQASILIEKTHPDYNGCPQFIFSEFCRRCWADHPEINVGDDWGIPTLRWTKESYRPSRRLNKYVLTRPLPAPTLFSIPRVRPRFASSGELPTVPAIDPAVRSTPESAVGDGRASSPRCDPPPAGTEPRDEQNPAPSRDDGYPVDASHPADGSPYGRPSRIRADQTTFPDSALAPSSDQIVIRPARMDDLPELCALERLCFEPDIAFSRRLIRALIHNGRAVFMVAEVNGLIAGCGIGLMRRGRRRPTGRIYDVAVNPAFRGRRLGTRLTQNVLEELCRRGVRRVYLEVRVDNDAAIRLYETLGFRFARLLPDYYRPGVHGQSMRLTLPDPAEALLFSPLGPRLEASHGNSK